MEGTVVWEFQKEGVSSRKKSEGKKERKGMRVGRREGRRRGLEISSILSL